MAAPEVLADSPDAGDVTMASATERWVLAATVGGAGMAMLDGTVVNLALRRIGSDLDATFGRSGIRHSFPGRRSSR